jgi:hypothetical protein
MRVWQGLCPLLLVVTLPLFAQSASAPAPASSASSRVADLPMVVVSGVQPGPGLWKVSKGDHVMWVLGTLSPLPRDMQWQAQEVEQVIAA